MISREERLEELKKRIHLVDMTRKRFDDCMLEFEDVRPEECCGEYDQDAADAESKLVNFVLDNRDLFGVTTRAINLHFEEPWSPPEGISNAL